MKGLVLDSLLKIKDPATRPTNYSGLCRNYRCLNSDKDDLRGELSRIGVFWSEWPEFSGCEIYPVKPPASTGPIDPLHFFTNSQRRMVNFYEGEYGEARLRLLDWLIERVKEVKV